MREGGIQAVLLGHELGQVFVLGLGGLHRGAGHQRGGRGAGGRRGRAGGGGRQERRWLGPPRPSAPARPARRPSRLGRLQAGRGGARGPAQAGGGEVLAALHPRPKERQRRAREQGCHADRAPGPLKRKWWWREGPGRDASRFSDCFSLRREPRDRRQPSLSSAPHYACVSLGDRLVRTRETHLAANKKPKKDALDKLRRRKFPRLWAPPSFLLRSPRASFAHA